MSKKYTIEEARKIFEDGGCKLLEEVYINSKTKMRYICSCKYKTEAETTLNSFIRGTRCNKCGTERMAAKNRRTIKEVKKIFKDGGCELLEKVYINTETKMRYICSCEYKTEAEITLSCFKRGQRCNKCGTKRGAEKNRRTIKEVKKIFKDGGCELLEDVYKNPRTKMRYRCSCKRIAKIILDHFQGGVRCRGCMGERLAEKNRKTLKELRKIFEDEGCLLLEDTYKNCHAKMWFVCNCRRLAQISLSHFQSGQRCKECAIERNSGKNNYRYNHNLTDEDREDRRKNPEYKKWRNEVYKRDDYTCHIRGEKGWDLVAHHLESYGNNVDLRLVVSNGITMSKELHILFHKLYGYGNNTTSQFNEFTEYQQMIEYQNLLNIEV